MKKLLLILSVLMSMALIIVGNAGAVSYSADYWMPTDDTGFFEIEFEFASYESDFGLFAYQSPNTRITIFDRTDEKDDKVYVSFEYNSGWQVTLDNSESINLGDEFGFFYAVYTGGTDDTQYDYLWFTDPNYNQDSSGNLVDTDIEHIRTQWLGFDSLYIQLDDQQGGGDGDWNDMTVLAHDLQPVPEPATILLLSSGLIGIAGAGRKKMFKK